jgi:hypothetical protein
VSRALPHCSYAINFWQRLNWQILYHTLWVNTTINSSLCGENYCGVLCPGEMGYSGENLLCGEFFL